MSQEKVYPKGFRCFPPNDNAPAFVLGKMIVTPIDLFQWLKENEQYLTDYKGEKQLRLNILNGEKGIYLTVDTYKKDQ